MGPGPAGGSWCELTGPEERRRPLSSWLVGGCPTAWGSSCRTTRRRSTGTIPEAAWAPAYNADGQPRQGADVAETTDLLDLTAWPKGMRVNRAPRAASPGRPAALRGRRGLPADRLRHQHKSRPARRPRGPPPATGPLPGDRIRCAKDTGLDRFPFAGVRSEPYLVPDRGPGPPACWPFPSCSPWPTPPPAPGSPARSACG